MRAPVLSLVLALAAVSSAAAAKEHPAKGRAARAGAHAHDGIASVEVQSPRLKLGDVVAGLGELADADLGPAPAPGVTRLFTRDELVATLDAQGIQGVRGIPDAVRVSRKLQVLGAEAIRELTTEALAASGLRQGVVLKSLQPPASVKVTSGYTAVSAQVPKSPRHAGDWTTTVVLSFEADGQRAARVAIPAVFAISPEAAQPTVAKGAILTLVVKSGLVEISTHAAAGDNADVGDVFPVSLRPSGKVVRARLVSPDHAILEGSTP